MGGEMSSDLDPSQWAQVRALAENNLAINRRTQTLSQRGKYECTDLSDQNLRELLLLRKNKLRHVAGVFGWEQQKGNFLSLDRRLTVYSECLEYRLDSLPQMSESKGLQVLLDSLEGFMTIYHATGVASRIEPSMIGFDKQGEVKVWINPNLCCLSPLESRGHDTLTVEHDLIDDLFSIVKSVVPGGRFSDRLLDYLVKHLAEPFTYKNVSKILTSWLRSPSSCQDSTFVIGKSASAVQQFECSRYKDISPLTYTKIGQVNNKQNQSKKLSFQGQTSPVCKTLTATLRNGTPIFMTSEHIAISPVIPSPVYFAPLGQSPLSTSTVRRENQIMLPSKQKGLDSQQKSMLQVKMKLQRQAAEQQNIMPVSLQEKVEEHWQKLKFQL